MKEKIGFIGLGLIGGSIAKAVRQYHPDIQLVAFDKNKESLALATQESLIDVAATTIDESFANCRYIFLCTPISYNNAYLSQIKEYMHEDCIITDVGSVKTSIHEKIEQLGLEDHFIGGHPMAGSEKHGYSNSKAMLIENAYYILTPTGKVPQEKIEAFRKFIESLKALPIVLSYEEHDYVTGVISHLPHIIASSLVNYVRTADTKDGLMKLLAAGGFKDITRIASSSPVMWQHICQSNRDNILTVLESYIGQLNDAAELIRSCNGHDIFHWFEISKNYRDSIPENSSGPLKKVFAIYCDIIDEAGGIATIATILASNNINIKNIGIVNNREFEEGVLRIEFYDETASAKAAELLRKYRYVVYER